MERKLKKIFILLCMIFLIAGLSNAQERGAIKGKVVDQDGVPLPGVGVSLSGIKIAPREMITTDQGNFRFMNLPVANDYKLVVELPGFKTITREELAVSFGRDIILSLVLEQTTLEESITVIGKTPTIDVKKTQVGVNITSDMIMSMPTARNPWVIMAMVPGMLISKEDVGGNEAGQQSGYSGHGSTSRDNTWSIDGANITDNSALGYAPAYVNIAGYEEVQINYGNNDIYSMTGGVQLNIISKRGGNAFSGTFYLDVSRDAWQSSNATQEVLDLYDTYDPGVDKIYLYGANFGGPIVQDKAWFYGSWGVQDIAARNINASTDKTWLVSAYGKVNLQVSPSTRIEGFLEWDNKNKWNRLWHSAAQSDADHSWNQTGPGYMGKVEWEQLAGNLYLNAKFIFMDGGFALHPVQGERTADGSGQYYIIDRTRPFYSGNIDDYGTNRDSYNLNVTGNYFAENIIGGDHDIKFGVDYLTSSVTTFDLYEGSLTLNYYGPDSTLPTGEWWEAWLLRDYSINLYERRIGFYIQDTMTFGNLSINIGIRYDQEKSLVKDEVQNASPWLPQFMPQISLDELDPGAEWKTFSPRLSLVYDIGGTGKNVVKASLARYGSQDGYGMARHVNPVGWTEIDVIWQDLNADTRVTSDELFGYNWDTGTVADVNDPDYWLWYGGLNPDNPTGVTMRNLIDPDFSSPLLDEFNLSYEREIMDDFSARLELFYKKSHNAMRSIGMLNAADASVLETSANYYQTGTADIVNQPVYGRTKYFPYRYRTNYENRNAVYKAAQIVFNKRLSKGWMMDASFTLSNWIDNREGDDINPQNVAFYDGGVNSSMNSRWQFKFSGLYQIPFGGINASWIFRAREGYVFSPYVWAYASGIGWTRVRGNEDGSGGLYGDQRRPTFYELDFRLEKMFMISGTSKVTLGFDAFNALNNHHTLELYSLITATSTFNKTSKILNPRVFRFGIRFDF